MQAKYDIKAQALYITLQDGKITQTIKLRDDVIVDLGSDNGVIGVEFLNPHPKVTAALIAQPSIPVTVA